MFHTSPGFLFVCLFLSNFIFFYWRIIALQNFVFCPTSTWISHRCTYIPSFWTSLPSPSASHPSRLIQSACLSLLNQTAKSCWLSFAYGPLGFVTMFSIMSVSVVVTVPVFRHQLSLSPCIPLWGLRLSDKEMRLLWQQQSPDCQPVTSSFMANCLAAISSAVRVVKGGKQSCPDASMKGLCWWRSRCSGHQWPRIFCTCSETCKPFVV